MKLNTRKINELRFQYPPGTRLKLIDMDDKRAPKPGTTGTVTGIDDAGQIIMKWDDGSTLSLLPDVDLFETT